MIYSMWNFKEEISIMSEQSFQKSMKELRESTGLNRKEFCEKFDIPYRTMTEWELGHRIAPPYVYRLVTYYLKFSLAFSQQ